MSISMDLSTLAFCSPHVLVKHFICQRFLTLYHNEILYIRLRMFSATWPSVIMTLAYEP